MNSIEIAKKLIEENEPWIEGCRSREAEIRKRIAELEEKIECQKDALRLLEDSLKREHDYLEEEQALKKEYLVDNLALKMFIANGGGLDMYD